jgi:opacity protein-like surface antigen
MHVRRSLAHALTLGAVLAAAAAGPALAEDKVTPSDAATQIRQIEQSGVFTPPTPLAGFTVGKFDAATGTFTGTKTRDVCQYDPELREIICEPGPPPTVTVNGVNVEFTVRWSGASGSVTVTVNGKPKTVPSGNGRASIDIGRAREAHWAIVANGRTYSDSVKIKRPAMVGAGVFTIKALPIGIAYEPPQDPGKLNNNRYTRVTTTATTLSSSVQTSTATTVPKTTSSDSFKAIAAAVGGQVPGPAGSALSQISAIVGNVASDVTTSQSTGSTTAIDVKLVQRRECTTGDHIGPGGGDKIVYLKDARVAWLDNGQQTYLALLGSNGSQCVSINTLKIGASPFDPATVQSLLAVDPLATGGPNMLLPATRYTYLYDVDLDPTTTDNPDIDSHSESRWTSLGSTTTTNKVTTDTLRAGFLAFLGVGPEQSQTTTVSMSASTSRVDGAGTEVTTTATLRTLRLGASTTIHVYYDKAFNTVVYQAAV